MATAPRSITPEEYIGSLEEPRRSEIKRLDQLIRKTLPKLERVVTAGFLGYGPFRYRYATGREGDMCVVSLCSKKNYISLHLFGADRFKDRLPKANIGVACVRFKRLNDLDQEALTELIKQAPKIRDMIEKKP